jgi:hypothetical protein
MSDIEDLNPEHMFDHLKTYLMKKQKIKKKKIIYRKELSDLFELFEDKIWEDLQKINASVIKKFTSLLFCCAEKL